MKVKIFSHKSDPDGLGSVILAKLQFSNVDVELAQDNLELDKQLKEFITNHFYTDYDQIFITDLCPSIKFLELIGNNEELRKKVLIFDHHQTMVDQIEKEYSFLTEMEVKENKKCCGTSLFYEYLLQNNPSLKIQRECVNQFVELTRSHDTYEWKQTDNKEAYYLQILFQVLGHWGYFYHFLKKCEFDEKFIYNKQENEWIVNQIKTNQEILKGLFCSLLIKEIDGIKYGVSIANYEYRNLLSDYISENAKDIDALLLIAGDEQRFSFRSLKEDISIQKVAENCGGGGHEKAAGGSLNNENMKRILTFIR